MGLGTGLLAAMAVALSKDAIELSKLGPSVVGLAFRLGLHVNRVSRVFSPRRESSDGGYGSIVIEGMDESHVGAIISQCFNSEVGIQAPKLEDKN